LGIVQTALLGTYFRSGEVLLADTCSFGKFSIDLRNALAETYPAAGDARLTSPTVGNRKVVHHPRAVSSFGDHPRVCAVALDPATGMFLSRQHRPLGAIA